MLFMNCLMFSSYSLAALRKIGRCVKGELGFTFFPKYTITTTGDLYWCAVNTGHMVHSSQLDLQQWDTVERDAVILSYFYTLLLFYKKESVSC